MADLGSLFELGYGDVGIGSRQHQAGIGISHLLIVPRTSYFLRLTSQPFPLTLYLSPSPPRLPGGDRYLVVGRRLPAERHRRVDAPQPAVAG